MPLYSIQVFSASPFICLDLFSGQSEELLVFRGYLEMGCEDIASPCIHTKFTVCVVHPDIPQECYLLLRASRLPDVPHCWRRNCAWGIGLTELCSGAEEEAAPECWDWCLCLTVTREGWLPHHVLTLLVFLLSPFTFTLKNCPSLPSLPKLVIRMGKKPFIKNKHGLKKLLKKKKRGAKLQWEYSKLNNSVPIVKHLDLILQVSLRLLWVICERVLACKL